MAAYLTSKRNQAFPLRKGMAGVLLLGLSWLWWNTLSKTKDSSELKPTLVSHPRPTIIDLQASIALPTSVSRPSLEISDRDPFAGSLRVLVPPITLKKSVPLRPQVVEAPVPRGFMTASQPLTAPAPSPPALNLRFIGQSISPEDERLVYAQLGQETVLLTKGAKLTNGYQVVDVQPKRVILLYAPLNYTTQLMLPDPPKYEIR